MGGSGCAQEVAARTSIAQTTKRIAIERPSFIIEDPPGCACPVSSTLALPSQATCEGKRGDGAISGAILLYPALLAVKRGVPYEKWEGWLASRSKIMSTSAAL